MVMVYLAEKKNAAAARATATPARSQAELTALPPIGAHRAHAASPARGSDIWTAIDRRAPDPIRPDIRPVIRSDIGPGIRPSVRPDIRSDVRFGPIAIPPGPNVVLFGLGRRLIRIVLRLQFSGTEDQEGSQSENSHAKHLKLLNESFLSGTTSPVLPLRRFQLQKGHSRPRSEPVAAARLPVGQRLVSLAVQETGVRSDERQIVDHGCGRDKAVGGIRVLEAQASTLLCHGVR